MSQRKIRKFAAAKCFVSEAQYRQWLAHYQQPTCDGHLSNGERCALPVDRVDTPGRFVDGDSNWWEVEYRTPELLYTTLRTQGDKH